MQIKEMEKDLGVALVERRSHDVVLTETGIEIARRGERILSEVNDLEDFARHRGGVLSGTLKFGVIPSIAPYCCRVCCRCCRKGIPISSWNCARPKRAFWSKSWCVAVSMSS